MRRIVGLLLATFLSVLLVACSGTPGTSPTPSPSGLIRHATGSKDLVLRVSTGGGFVPLSYFYGHVPELSIFGDGRVVITGPVATIYPGQLLPNLQQERISEAGLQKVLRAAIEAGLSGPDRTLTLGGIADAPTTTFTINVNGTSHRSFVYALGMDPGGELPGSSTNPGEIALRTSLAALNGKLADLAGLAGADAITDRTPYAASGMRLFIMAASTQNQDPSFPQPLLTWPLASTVPLATAGTPVFDGSETRCTVVAGTDLATLLPAMQGANQLSTWKDGAALWKVIPRPLLPDESGCATGS